MHDDDNEPEQHSLPALASSTDLDARGQCERQLEAAKREAAELLPVDDDNAI